MRLAALVLAVLVATGCAPSDGPTMRPGENCLQCHGGVPSGGQHGSSAKAWSFAGTVYQAVDAPAGGGVEGATVDVTDAGGQSISVRSNLVGNFYSAESMTPPLQACVEFNGVSRCMIEPAPHGACNYCHALAPLGGAPGRIVVGGTQNIP
jgi:hypothetical protein